MLSILKKFFSKSPAPTTAQPSAMTAPASTASSATVPATKAAAPIADAMTVTLKGVVAGLPDPLKGRLDRKLTGSELIEISRAEVMRQLPTGAIKIPFSEVLRMAPPNTFLSTSAEGLATLVNLPLGEILPKIKALPRKTAQKVVEVPKDLADVFGAGQSPTKPLEVAPPTAPPPPSPAPPTPPVPVAAPVSTPPVPRPITPAPPAPPAPVVAKEDVYTPPPPKPLPPQAPISLKPMEPVAPLAPPPTPLPVPTPAPAVQKVEPPPVFAAPVPKPIVAAKPADAAPTLGFGDIFGQPDKAEWTPQEIADKAAALRGVAGALITTIDGLPVAFHLPENLSGNMVAAFVPQMYTRIIQYTRDLKLGEAKHLTILIENVPLQIFKAGKYYFTVLGRANENLPKPQLTAITAALERQGES